MKHWSVDEEKMRKSPEAFAIWSLENSINFGMRKNRLKKADLLMYWNKLDLDHAKKRFLSLLLKK